MDLHSLLWHHVKLNATDPLDNVYALLGLAKEKPLAPLLPNYSRDWRELYRDLTLSMIRSEENLTGLCRESLHNNEALPSWVLNCEFIDL